MNRSIALALLMVLTCSCSAPSDDAIESRQQDALFDRPFGRSEMWNKDWDKIDASGPRLANDPALAWSKGELHIFGEGEPFSGDHHALLHKWWDGKRWFSDTLIVGHGDMDSAPAAVAHGDVIDVFFDQLGDLTHMQWNTSAGAFSSFGSTNFESLGTPTTPDGTSAVWGDAPAASVAKVYGRFHSLIDKLDVFVHGPGHHLWQRSWTGAPPFGPWVDQGGFMTSAPAAASLAVNLTAVVYRDGRTPGRLVERVEYIDHMYAGETAIRGISPVGSAALVSPAGARDAGAGPELFGQFVMDAFVAADDGLYRSHFDYLGEWGPWFKMADCVHGAATIAIDSEKQQLFASAPAAASDGGRTDVVVWGTDGGVWRDYRSIWASALGVGIKPPCDCNKLGDACCGGTSCGGELICDARTHKCDSCGGLGHVCCSGNVCDAALTCNPGTGTCEPGPTCGVIGLDCCDTRNIGCVEGVCGADDKCVEPAKLSEIYATIFMPQRCNDCHYPGSPKGGFVGADAGDTYKLLLSPPRMSVTKVPPPQQLLVDTTKPASESYLYQKVLPVPPSGKRMGSLDDAQRNMIYSWIKNGAPND